MRRLASNSVTVNPYLNPVARKKKLSGFYKRKHDTRDNVSVLEKEAYTLTVDRALIKNGSGSVTPILERVS